MLIPDFDKMIVPRLNSPKYNEKENPLIISFSTRP